LPKLVIKIAGDWRYEEISFTHSRGGNGCTIRGIVFGRYQGGCFVNRIGCSISREIKVVRDDGALYLQRSTCSIELRFEQETAIFISVLWHTGAKLLGHGRKDWQVHSLAQATKELQEYKPGVEVPYQVCLSDTLAHLPLNVVRFDPGDTNADRNSDAEDRPGRERTSSMS
jgi:hypothetical protein